MRELRAAALALVLIGLVCGLAYPLGMTLFGGKADADLIGRDHSKDLSLFQSRPSATGYSATATFFNNQGPNQKELAEQLKANVKAYLKRERPTDPGLRAATIPVDAVTTSASGVDPDISAANARIQARRVAQRRGLPLRRVLALVDARGNSVNVNQLNRALEDLR